MRILVAEDDKRLAEFLKKGLKEEQYAVDICYDGEEALFLAEINSYDLIILDVMLPKKNGFSVCRQLREMSLTTPVIMLTARDQVKDRVRGLQEGADDYIPKPFSFEELVARIKALFRRSQQFMTKSLKVSDLILDPVSRSVRRGNKKIDLTGKEYALLEYLLRNKGRIVTQSMIIEHVWDMDYDGFSNVVNVYINHLREKIDRGYDKPIIQTIRGMGFKIDDQD